MVCPFFGGIACTGALARTATNIRAGARSPLASVFQALFLLACAIALAPDFDAYYLAWIQAIAHNQLLPGAVAPGACPLPRALSHYLAGHERRQGIAAGTLGADAMRAAFVALPPGSIRCEASGDDPYFPDGTSLDRCPTCAAMLARLEGLGLAPDRVAEGQTWPPPAGFRPPEDVASI